MTIKILVKGEHFLKKLKKFLSYVITVPKYIAEKQLDSNQLIDIFNYVNFYQVEDVYSLDTGFKKRQYRITNFLLEYYLE